MAREAGYGLNNADVTIVAEEPKLSPHREAMVAALTETLGLPVDAVNVKATTNEGLGPAGEGMAIACHAIVAVTGTPRPAKHLEEDQT
jgi:2-C-methyl-D-erythritol 2,4-cyclodiphosphate synthase